MFQIHNSKDFSTPIIGMDDNHLVNTIKLIVTRNLQPILDYEKAMVQSDDSVLKYFVDDIKKPKMNRIQMVRHLMSSDFLFYLCEGLRRNSTHEQVQEILVTLDPMFSSRAGFAVPKNALAAKNHVEINDEYCDDFDDEFTDMMHGDD